MTPEDTASLSGRTLAGEDRADGHRWAAYRRYFGLGPNEAPLAFHWLLFSAIPEQTRDDGHAVAMAPFPPLPYPRRMWAGGEIAWQHPIQVGETVVRDTSVLRADLKTGAGGDFLLASLTHRISCTGEARIEERQDIVFLPPSKSGGSTSPRLLPFTPDWQETRIFGPVDLFRYSALTLNSHRIHYDAAFAQDVEHYPGLVVHGPLLASHLIHAGARHSPGWNPRSFSYRAVAPLFAGEAARLVGLCGGDRLDLAIIGPDDGVRTIATMILARDLP